MVAFRWAKTGLLPEILWRNTILSEHRRLTYPFQPLDGSAGADVVRPQEVKHDAHDERRDEEVVVDGRHHNSRPHQIQHDLSAVDHRVRQQLVYGPQVFGEAIQNPARGVGVEELHRRRDDAVEHAIMQTERQSRRGESAQGDSLDRSPHAHREKNKRARQGHDHGQGDYDRVDEDGDARVQIAEQQGSSVGFGYERLLLLDVDPENGVSWGGAKARVLPFREEEVSAAGEELRRHEQR
jgi:hypothetical protein